MRLAVGLADGRVEVWALPAGEGEETEPEGEPLRASQREVTALGFSPDGAGLAVGCADGGLHIFFGGGGGAGAGGRRSWSRLPGWKCRGCSSRVRIIERSIGFLITL